MLSTYPHLMKMISPWLLECLKSMRNIATGSVTLVSNAKDVYCTLGVKILIARIFQRGLAASLLFCLLEFLKYFDNTKVDL